MSPTCHGRSSIGISPTHERVVLSPIGASNMAHTWRMRVVIGVSQRTSTLTVGMAGSYAISGEQLRPSASSRFMRAAWWRSSEHDTTTL